MAHLLDLTTHTDVRGNLTVIEKVIPFDIKRIFYIYGVDDSIRGGHRHKKTIQALICLKGSCVIFNDNNKTKQTFTLNKPSKCLILDPEDWHTLSEFSNDAIIMVLASEYYTEEDYIFNKYDESD